MRKILISVSSNIPEDYENAMDEDDGNSINIQQQGLSDNTDSLLQK